METPSEVKRQESESDKLTSSYCVVNNSWSFTSTSPHMGVGRYVKSEAQFPAYGEPIIYSDLFHLQFETWNIWGSHSGVDADSSLLGCYALSTGYRRFGGLCCLLGLVVSLNRSWVGAVVSLEGYKKRGSLFSPPGFAPRTVQPAASSCANYAIPHSCQEIQGFNIIRMSIAVFMTLHCWHSAIKFTQYFKGDLLKDPHLKGCFPRSTSRLSIKIWTYCSLNLAIICLWFIERCMSVAR
jgi:hypothetical protein